MCHAGAGRNAVTAIDKQKRVAFVTIGQAPRPDLTPDIVAAMRMPVIVSEYGALDGLDGAAIAALAPDRDEPRLVTRLRDGREVLLGKTKMQRRLQGLFDRIDGEGFDLIVLLCTGQFEPFALRTLFLEPQPVVDHFVEGLAHGARTLGVLVPNAAQIGEFHGIADKRIVGASASPYSDGDFEAAGRALAGTDMVVMHCMGYSEAMRRRVAATAGRPVMLARSLVAHGIDLLLE